MSGYKNKNDKMSRKQYTGFRALLKNPWIFAGSALLLDTVMLVVGLILANLHPEVEYTLTETGYSLKPILDSMVAWGTDYKKNIGQM